MYHHYYQLVQYKKHWLQLQNNHIYAGSLVGPCNLHFPSWTYRVTLRNGAHNMHVSCWRWKGWFKMLMATAPSSSLDCARGAQLLHTIAYLYMHWTKVRNLQKGCGAHVGCLLSWSYCNPKYLSFYDEIFTWYMHCIHWWCWRITTSGPWRLQISSIGLLPLVGSHHWWVPWW